MEEKSRAERDAERDAFWDIDALIPPRRAAHYAADTESVEIVLEPQTEPSPIASEPIPASNSPERHCIPPHKPHVRVPDVTYTPENSLIRSVSLYRLHSPYPYYEDFVRDARRLQPVAGAPCQRIPFFSYVPQYSQMNRAQLEWYVWWRENFRHGEVLTTDYSYILLYAYEILNLDTEIEPAVGQETLCRLWVSYRDIFHQLDGYLPEWICDYSLIHRLPPPASLQEHLGAIMAHCRLREFYISTSGEAGLVRALMTLASEYDYRKSKFYTKENAPLYDRLIFGALSAVGQRMGEDGKFFDMDAFAQNQIEREAYRGALCAHRIKYRIALQYVSLYCSGQLRQLVSELIKYTENRIRASLGIRARLGVYTLTEAQKQAIDAYLTPLLPTRRRIVTTTAEVPAYEKHYDLPRAALSLDHARKIESASWQTTERLIEAFEEDALPEPPSPSAPPAPPNTFVDADAPQKIGNVPEQFSAYLPFLEAAMEANAAEQMQCAKALGRLVDVVVDEINELAADAYGDILLESVGAGYAVLDDYRDTVITLIEQGKKE